MTLCPLKLLKRVNYCDLRNICYLFTLPNYRIVLELILAQFLIDKKYI